MDKDNAKIKGANYLRDFRCTASECMETCCSKWIVNIDNKTYKKYKRLKDEPFKSLVKKNLKRVPILKSSSDIYGYLDLDENLLCPFLNQDKLCSFQLKYGEEYLSCVCNTFPRVLNLVDGIYEETLDLSCAEAARIVLLYKEPIELIEIAEKFEEKHYKRSVFRSDRYTFINFYKKYFHELRGFTINLMLDRKHKLWERLFMLGVFYKMADTLCVGGKVLEIPKLINTFPEVIKQENIKNNILQMGNIYTIQIELLKVLSERVASKSLFADYETCYKEFFEGIGYNKNVPIEQIAQRYEKAYKKYYKPFMDKHEYIFENYLINYIYKNLFPYSKLLSLFDNYVIFILHYAIIKLHLIGMSAYHKGLSKELVVKLIYSFTRTFEHNPKYFMDVLLLLKKNNFCDLSAVTILIKN